MPLEFMKLLRCLILTGTVVFLASCAATGPESRSNRTVAGLDNQTEENNQLANKTPTELVSYGRDYMNSGNLALARIHFIMAVSKQPEMAEAYVALGDLEFRSGNYPAAFEHFDRALSKDNGLLSAHLGQSRALRQQGLLDKAVESVNAALAIAPSDTSVTMELAAVYDQMGSSNLSDPLYLDIISREPNNAAAYNNLGLNQLVREEYQEAILSFVRALNLQPSNQQISNNLAAAHALNGDEFTAVNLFKETVGEAAAYNNIGYLYMTQGRFDKAEKALRTAISLNPRFYSRAQANLDRLQEMRRQAKTAAK